MSTKHEIGKKGEDLAREFLEGLGYEIVATNWRFGKGEIDIIAYDDAILVFVEVKSRSSISYGRPETFINEKKIAKIAGAASAFMNAHNHEWEFRFDVISIIFTNGKQYELKHFLDAFFPGLL